MTTEENIIGRLSSENVEDDGDLVIIEHEIKPWKMNVGDKEWISLDIIKELNLLRNETFHITCNIYRFFQDEQVRPVQMRNASSASEVQEIYDEWVVGEGAEGLVVHSEGPIVWKVKPRHTIDAAVIGYTVADRGIRDLMMAVRRPDGLFQMFALGSTGLSDEDRVSLAKRREKTHVESQYVLSDSRGIAY